MIRAFFSVVVDLWRFVIGARKAAVARTYVSTPYRLLSVPTNTPVLPLPAHQEPVLLGAVSPQAKVVVRGSDVLIPVHTTHAALPGKEQAMPPAVSAVVDETIKEDEVKEEVNTWVSLSDRFPSMPIFSSEVFYIAASLGTPLLTAPQLDFDGATATLAYGQSVTVRAYRGGYAEVTSSAGAGYVHKDALSPHYYEVWPHYKNGEQYDCDSAPTIATRRLLADTFLASKLSLPLQAGEYILIRLLRDHHAIVWPPVRPRLAGTWHQILRGVPGVRSGVHPLTDTIMEWQAEDGTGRLAYVEAVLSDATLRVSGVGLSVAGEYSELTFKPELWREWRPVFITITS